MMLIPVLIASRHQKQLCCTSYQLFSCLDLWNVVVAVMLPLASHDANTNTSGIALAKFYVALHFNCGDLRNAKVLDMSCFNSYGVLASLPGSGRFQEAVTFKQMAGLSPKFLCHLWGIYIISSYSAGRYVVLHQQLGVKPFGTRCHSAHPMVPSVVSIILLSITFSHRPDEAMFFSW